MPNERSFIVQNAPEKAFFPPQTRPRFPERTAPLVEDDGISDRWKNSPSPTRILHIRGHARAQALVGDEGVAPAAFFSRQFFRELDRLRFLSSAKASPRPRRERSFNGIGTSRVGVHKTKQCAPTCSTLTSRAFVIITCPIARP
ncbi:hypothetical protein MTO96_001948 [Rhipicephalus appendiculatus]